MNCRFVRLLTLPLQRRDLGAGGRSLAVVAQAELLGALDDGGEAVDHGALGVAEGLLGALGRRRRRGRPRGALPQGRCMTSKESRAVAQALDLMNA